VNREQLAHVLRAAAEIVPGADIVVIGSQAVLATRDEADLPIEATRSIEVDLAFFDDPDEAKADAVDGAIGELSRFHETFGYYGQGVSLTTPVLSEGWTKRLIRLETPDPAARIRALEVHDCAVSKLVAFREKDREFASALLEAGVIARASIAERLEQLPGSVLPARRIEISRWLDRHRSS
jgi:hypothetical protein